jgi:hypothetical protein
MTYSQEEILITASNGIPVVYLIYLHSLIQSCHYKVLHYIQREMGTVQALDVVNCLTVQSFKTNTLYSTILLDFL